MERKDSRPNADVIQQALKGVRVQRDISDAESRYLTYAMDIVVKLIVALLIEFLTSWFPLRFGHWKLISVSLEQASILLTYDLLQDSPSIAELIRAFSYCTTPLMDVYSLLVSWNPDPSYGS